MQTKSGTSEEVQLENISSFGNHRYRPVFLFDLARVFWTEEPLSDMWN
jgi:hypothetical protein